MKYLILLSVILTGCVQLSTTEQNRHYLKVSIDCQHAVDYNWCMRQ